MRPWKEYSFDPIAHEAGISASLGEWLREKLRALPPTTISLETNLGGLDEAGTVSPDLDWAGMVATEFPGQRIETRYRLPQGPEEGAAPYFATLEITGQGILKAEVLVKGPGAWVICEEYLGRGDGCGAREPGRNVRAS